MTPSNGSTNGTVKGALTLDQARRYARHIILPEVGPIGQRTLRTIPTRRKPLSNWSR